MTKKDFLWNLFLRLAPIRKITRNLIFRFWGKVAKTNKKYPRKYLPQELLLQKFTRLSKLFEKLILTLLNH